MAVSDGVWTFNGETLRVVCEALGVKTLAAQGFVAPGIPLSCTGNGRWAGLPVISKSGAFGDRTTLVRLLRSRGSFSPNPHSSSTGEA